MSRRAITRRAALIGLASLAFRRAAAADSRQADRIIVLKGARRLELVRDGVVMKSFPIRLGRYPEGPKIFELDGRTPEGEYFIDGRSSKTPYHLALHISYPQAENVALAAKYNLPPGGGIFIHGTPGAGPRFEYDWTDGCIAVTNGAIEEIWAVVEDGTPIEIRP
jgi:murein L,D-transpeptidase YafK